MEKFSEIRWQIYDKVKSITFNEVRRLIVNMFDCDRIAFTEFLHPDINDLQLITRSASLDDSLTSWGYEGHHVT